MGNALDCWALYSSTGPYLTHVGMEVDGRWIVVCTPVHIEIQAKVAAARNFSSGKNHMITNEPRHEETGVCLCENKGADQLRSNCEADQRLCFRYMDSTIPLLSKYKIFSF